MLPSAACAAGQNQSVAGDRKTDFFCADDAVPFFQL